MTLLNLIDRMGERRDGVEQGLTTALREFFQEFEHTTSRMSQVLYSRRNDPDFESKSQWMDRWCDLTFRFSVYALTSFWIPDKTEETTIRMTMNVRTGRTVTSSVTNPMQVPREYRRTTRDI